MAADLVGCLALRRAAKWAAMMAVLMVTMMAATRAGMRAQRLAAERVDMMAELMALYTFEHKIESLYFKLILQHKFIATPLEKKYFQSNCINSIIDAYLQTVDQMDLRSVDLMVVKMGTMMAV